MALISGGTLLPAPHPSSRCTHVPQPRRARCRMLTSVSQLKQLRLLFCSARTRASTLPAGWDPPLLTVI